MISGCWCYLCPLPIFDILSLADFNSYFGVFWYLFYFGITMHLVHGNLYKVHCNTMIGTDDGSPCASSISTSGVRDHAQITTSKLVVLGLGNPSVSVPHNRERTRQVPSPR